MGYYTRHELTVIGDQDYTIDHEKQISESTKRMLGNSLAKGKQYRNTSILQFEKGILIQEFNSIKEAAIKFKTTQSNICHCLNGRTKKHKGYEWRYKKDFNA